MHSVEPAPNALSGSKVTSPDPPLPAVGTVYPPEPLLTFFDPVVELPSSRPRGRVHLDGRINCSAVCFAVLARIDAHI